MGHDKHGLRPLRHGRLFHMSDRKASELAEFLSARRAQLTPQDAGLDGQVWRRRVPGLRREELARLAEIGRAHV